MTDLNDLSSSLRERLPRVLSLSLLMLVLTGEMIFAITQIVPSVRAHTALSAQLAEAQAALVPPAGEAVLEAAAQKRLDKLQAALAETAAPFLLEAEVPEAINHLYRYADDAAVQIMQIEAVRTAQAKTGAAPTAHAIQTFKVEVAGPALQLVAFVTRIEEAALPTVVLDGLSLKPGRGASGASVLTLQIHYYTSPFAAPAAP